MIGFNLDHYGRFDNRHAAVIGVWEESDKKRINWGLGLWFENVAPT